MVILSKGSKPGNFEPHNSLKLSFTNIRGLHSNFVEYEYLLESNSTLTFQNIQNRMSRFILVIFERFSMEGYP